MAKINISTDALFDCLLNPTFERPNVVCKDMDFHN